MTSQGLAFMSATELGGILRDRKASPVEAVEAYLQRIEQLNPSLNAYHFFAAISFITSISKSRSATSFLSRAFSTSSFLSLCASASETPWYFLRQR